MGSKRDARSDSNADRGEKLNRRHALRLMGLGAAGLFAARCAPGPAQPGTVVAPPTATKMVVPTAGPLPTAVGGVVRGGSLKAGVISDILNYDPATIVGMGNSWISHLCRSSLAAIDWNNQVVPDLAESWEHENGQRWVFHLRRGVKWHTGREVVADDVLYSLGRVLDPEVGSPARALFSSIVKMGKEDDYTVVIELEQPNLDFPSYHNAYQAKILPADQPVAEHNTNPIGTGPFVLVEAVPGERAVLRKNEDYFIPDQPIIDEVVMYVMSDGSTRVAGLQAGTIHLAQEVNWDDFRVIDADPSLIPTPGLPILAKVLYMDVTSPPFNDKRVRDAMRYIADRQTLLDVAYYGQGSVSCDSQIIPGNPYRVEQLGICEQNIDKAKALLAEAGYADGLRFDLWTIGNRAPYINTALAFQEQARAAGVTIEVRAVPNNVFYSEHWLNAKMGVSAWGPRPTADAQIRLAYACGGNWNETHFCNEDMEAILDQALVEGDETKRKELYTRVQEIIATEGGTIVPFFYPRLSAHRTSLMGYHPDPIASTHDLRQVWLAAEA